jgi:excisionase family DNA binding protein
VSDERLLTVADVQLRLRIGQTLARELIATGAIRSCRIGGRAIRVSESALSDYVRQCESGRENEGATGLRPPVALDGGGVHAARRHTAA